MRGWALPRRVTVGVNDLATTHPRLAAELVDARLAMALGGGSHRKVEWRCEHGHTWVAEVKSRACGGNGCPVCSNRLIVAGTNDIATVRPDLAREMVDADLARTLGPGSSKRVEWECPYGHRWWATVVSRSRLGNGCPVCANQRVEVGVNDLATTHPELAAELVDKDLATRIVAGTDRKVRWRCEAGHEWEATVASRKGGAGCPYCAGSKVIVDETDLATTHPEIAAQLVDQDLAKELGRGSDREVEWRCEHGHTWIATPATRVRGVGCPVCSNRSVVRGLNDLATTNPELVGMLVDRRDAQSVSAGSGKVLRWRCGRGHVWSAPVCRVSGGSGCPVCAGQRIQAGFNDLATTHPEMAAQLVDQSLAKKVSFGSHREVEWRCERGHVWTSQVQYRSSSMECPICSGHGSSAEERDFVAAVRELAGGLECVANSRRLISPQEVDLVIPDRHLALEFNGLWWHSEDAGKARTYHRDKRRACEAAGYRLIQVWEDTWRERRDVVLRMVERKVGAYSGERVFARRLEVREISHALAAPFLEANHIQGSVLATMHVGGFVAGRLVCVMSLRDAAMSSRSHYAQGEWEVRRYATSVLVVGGFTKLLAFAEREIGRRNLALTRWVSISDCDVSDGHMYAACGFSLDRELPCDYRYWGTLTGNVRRPKESFQKRRFREREDLVFEEGLTEAELARLNGLHRCWDSGKLRWVREVGS